MGAIAKKKGGSITHSHNTHLHNTTHTTQSTHGFPLVTCKSHSSLSSQSHSGGIDVFARRDGDANDDEKGERLNGDCARGVDGCEAEGVDVPDAVVDENAEDASEGIPLLLLLLPPPPPPLTKYSGARGGEEEEEEEEERADLMFMSLQLESSRWKNAHDGQGFWGRKRAGEKK